MKMPGLKMMPLFFLMVGGISVTGQQDRQNVPGDDFSLEGALELFKKSASPEEFERLLNSASSKVNNLDLNGDGEIDYIRVIDQNDGNVHLFILQAIVSDTERQDVAVIELEKLANGKAVLQITGDEDVYGIETIIEPTQEVRVNAGTTTTRTVVNVWAWPSVQYVYSPYYTVWSSPWHWHVRPAWWSSWRPVAYYEYYGYWHPYRSYYSHCHTHRVVYAQHIYRPYRRSSAVYFNRHQTQIAHYRSNYRDDRISRDRNDDRNRGAIYSDVRTSRTRYEGSNNRNNHTTKRTPAVRQRPSSMGVKERSMDYREQRKGKPDVEKRPDVKRDQVFISRSDVRSKTAVQERSLKPWNQRSTSVNTIINSQPGKNRSNERFSEGGKPSGGEKRSNDRGKKEK